MVVKRQRRDGIEAVGSVNRSSVFSNQSSVCVPSDQILKILRRRMGRR